MAVTGTLSGSMTLWDLATQKQRLQCKHTVGLSFLHILILPYDSNELRRVNNEYMTVYGTEIQR